MKDSLIEIKNHLQENNSTVDEAKIQINDLEHKEAKNNQSENTIGYNPGHHGSVGWSVIPYTTKSCRFHPWSGHIWETTNQCLSLSLSLSLSFSLSLSTSSPFFSLPLSLSNQ